MDLKVTSIFTKTIEAWEGKKRHCLHEGGTSSSKTWSILQFIIVLSFQVLPKRHPKTPIMISIVSESRPHITRGCVRDFFNILGESQDNNPRWNKTDLTYKPDKYITIEFFGAEDDSKVRGPRRQILVINEANNVPWETARQLDVRTEMFTIADWNPTGEFWAHEQWLPRGDTAFIRSTYLDAMTVLSAATVTEIESYRDTDPNWWRVYGLGLVGKIENLIWPHYEIIDELPPTSKWRSWGYGLDWGFRHKTALIKVVNTDTARYWDEIIHESELTNSDIIQRMSHINRADIWADSARPDQIEELCRAGYTCYPANKRVQTGIDVVRRTPLYITRRSVGIIKEVRNYCWKQDRDSHILDEPVKRDDDAMDAGRYGTLGLTERYGYATSEPTPEAVVSYNFG